MAEVRREKDSLGGVEVPVGALYGAQTARAVENFPISGMRASPFLIRAMGMVKRAAAEANGELGVVSRERADAIAAAAQEVIDGRWDAEFVVDVFQAGAGVSFHMNANEVIANRANQLMAARGELPGMRCEVGEAGPFAALRDDKQKDRQDALRDKQAGLREDEREAGPFAALRDDNQKDRHDALRRGEQAGLREDEREAGPFAALRDDKQKYRQDARRDEQAVRREDGREAGPFAALRDDKREAGPFAALRDDKQEDKQQDKQEDKQQGRQEGRHDLAEAERAALGKYAWVHPNDHVNYGQSTNDVFPTAMRLGTLLALEGLYPVLDGLAGSFAAKGRKFDGVLKAGRTHMQDAVPIRLGQEFAAYGVAMAKAKESIARAGDSLRELGLGGSAVGTGINTHPEYRALAIAKLGRISAQYLAPASDMRWAMQSCAPMAEVSGALRGLALEVIRIANDLRLMSSGPNTGFNEIALPSLQPGSSIMPGKINPVLAELASMVSFQVVGNDAAVAMAVQAGQLELNVMMPAMAYNVLQSVEILTNMLRELDVRCVRGIVAHAERCEFYAHSTVALATALNPYIGYAKVAELVKESIASGRSAIELAREKGLLSEAQIAEILAPEKMTGA